VRAVAGALLVTLLDAVLLILALGSPAALLAHARALALLGSWAVLGLVLSLVRPVREQDPVAHDREGVALLVGLLLVPLVAPPLGALGERLGIATGWAPAWLEWLGVACVALGLGLRIAAMTTLGSRFSPVVTVQRDHALVTHGPYARVRHPGYLGALVACAGAMLAFGSALPLPLVIAFALLLRRRITREERLLESAFGDRYRLYRTRAGALLPRFGRGPGVA